MANRKKPKKRRLLFLLIAFVVLIGLGAGAYFYRQARLDDRARTDLREGRLALDAGEYSRAAGRIGRYLKRFESDPHALRDYALAISKLKGLERGAVDQAIASLRRALNIAPHLSDARKLLLDFYQMIGFSKEAIETAERIHQDDSRDTVALWALTTEHARLREFSEARRYARDYIQAEPDELKGYFNLLSIESGLETNPAIVRAWAEEIEARHPGDRKFKLLLGTAHILANETEEARKLLKPLAGQPLPDVEYASRLVSALDMMREVDLSTELLWRAAAQYPTGAMVEGLVRRLWERSRFDDLLTALDRLSAEDAAKLRPDTEGLRILCLARLGRAEKAAEYLGKQREKLAKNRGPGAMAWLSILEGVVKDDGAAAPAEKVDTALEACEKFPAEPVFYFYLGEAYERVGEFDLAIQSWIESSRRSFSWTKPGLRAARRLLAMGYVADASKVLDIVKERWPADPEIPEVEFALQGMLLPEMSLEDRASLTARLQEDAGATPESSSVLEVVALVLTGDHAVAREAIRTEISREDATDDRVFIALSWIADSFDPALGAECRAKCEERFGRTVNLAYFEAVRLRADGETGEGIRLLETGKAAAEGPEARAWDLAIARFLALAGDDRAAAKWAELADAYPDDVEVQIQVSEAMRPGTDRGLRERTVARLKKITGESGLRWRILESRLLLDGDDRSEQDYARAANLLGQVLSKAPHLRPLRILYGYALEKMGNKDAALEQLALSSSDQMVVPAVELQLASGYLTRGDRAAAEKHLNRFDDLKGLSPLHLEGAAALWLSLGKAEKALIALGKVPEDAPDEGGRRLLLKIRALVGVRDIEQAGRLVKLALETPDAQRALLAVDFYAMTSDFQLAEEWANKLESFGLAPAAAALVRGDFYRRTNRPEAALQAYLKAMVIDSGDISAWRRVLATRAALGVKEDLLRSFDDGFADPARVGALPALAAGRDLLEFAADKPALRALLVTWIESPDWSEAAGSMLAKIRDFNSKSIDQNRFLDDMTEAAKGAPGCWPVQEFAVSQLMAYGRKVQGLDAARAAALAQPSRPEPRRLLSLILASEGRYDEALAEARRWKERSPRDPLPADRAIAGIEIERGNPKDAIRALEGYVNRRDLPAEVSEQIVFVYSRALMETGKAEAARSRLWPLIPGSADLRRNLIPLIVKPDLLSEADGVRWLTEVESHIPSDAIPELLPVVDGWLTLSRRFGKDDYRDRGVAVLDRLTAVENLKASDWTLIGMMQEKAAQREKALESYRKALALQPDQLVAMNNLSMVLSDRGEHEEALKLARAIVEVQPENTEFLDTLAIACRNADRPAEAITRMKEAERLEPENLRWKLALAELCAQIGSTGEAKNYLAQIQLAVRGGKRLTPEQEERLEKVRKGLLSGTGD